MSSDPQKIDNQIRLLNSCSSLMFTLGCLLPLAAIAVFILLGIAGVLK